MHTSENKFETLSYKVKEDAKEENVMTELPIYIQAQEK